MYRLLIADDEKLERDALRYIVQKGSLAIDEIEDASNGREAISKAVQLQPHICFLDIKMPGISGIEAARQIKQVVPGVRVVFLTAFDYFDYAKEAIRIGVEDFIIKPASDSNVIEVIQNITEALDRDRNIRERNERVEQKLDRVTEAMQCELAESLARGYADTDKLSEYVAFCEFQFESIVAARIVLDYDSYPMKIQGETQETILRKRCLRVVQNELQDAGHFVLTAVVPDGIIALCFVPQNDTRVRFLLENASARIRRDFTIETVIGVSLAAQDVEQVGQLLWQAEHAVRDRTSPGPIRSYREVHRSRNREIGPLARRERATTAPELFPPEELEGRLVRSLLACDRRSSDDAMDDVYRWLSARVHTVAELSERMKDFFVVIRHGLSRRLPKIQIDVDALARDLRDASRAQAVRSAAYRHLASLLDALETVSAHALPVAVRYTCEFIDSHYNEEISLDMLAQSVRHSTYHLSRLFKRHTGANVVEYINSVRIGRAKQLLETGRFTVKEVSLQTGYSDAAYFARVFRRLEGVTPSVYRDRSAGSQ